MARSGKKGRLDMVGLCVSPLPRKGYPPGISFKGIGILEVPGAITEAAHAGPGLLTGAPQTLHPGLTRQAARLAVHRLAVLPQLRHVAQHQPAR